MPSLATEPARRRGEGGLLAVSLQHEHQSSSPGRSLAGWHWPGPLLATSTDSTPPDPQQVLAQHGYGNDYKTCLLDNNDNNKAAISRSSWELWTRDTDRHTWASPPCEGDWNVSTPLEQRCTRCGPAHLEKELAPSGGLYPLSRSRTTTEVQCAHLEEELPQVGDLNALSHRAGPQCAPVAQL